LRGDGGVVMTMVTCVSARLLRTLLDRGEILLRGGKLAGLQVLAELT